MEIDRVDLLFYLLRRWKSLVAVLVIGAVLGGAFGMVKATKEANAVVEEYHPAEDVEKNMQLAAQYRQLYEQQLAYNKNSLIMQMDPNQVYEGTLSYYLDAGDNTAVLAEVFSRLFDDDEVLQEIRESAGLDVEDQYLREILVSTVGTDKHQENEQINVSNSTTKLSYSRQTQGETQKVTTVPTIVTYQVSYSDQDICGKMLAVIQNAVEELNQKNQAAYGTYNWNLMQNTVSVVTSQEYQTRQNTSASLMDSYASQITTLEKDFSGEDKAYYKVVYLNHENDTSLLSTSKTEVAKWIVIAAFLGMIIWGGIFGALYLLDPSVKTVDELKFMHLPVIGYLSGEKNTEKIGWLDQKCKKAIDTPEYVAGLLKLLPGKHILLCLNEEYKGSADAVQQILQENLELKAGKMLQKDESSLEMAKDMDGVVLVVEEGKTARFELIRELEVCQIQNITIYGVVVVRGM